MKHKTNSLAGAINEHCYRDNCNRNQNGCEREEWITR